MEFDFKKGGKIRPWNDSEPTLTQACGITHDLYSQLLRRLKKQTHEATSAAHLTLCLSTGGMPEAQ